MLCELKGKPFLLCFSASLKKWKHYGTIMFVLCKKDCSLNPRTPQFWSFLKLPVRLVIIPVLTSSTPPFFFLFFAYQVLFCGFVHENIWCTLNPLMRAIIYFVLSCADVRFNINKFRIERLRTWNFVGLITLCYGALNPELCVLYCVLKEIEKLYDSSKEQEAN